MPVIRPSIERPCVIGLRLTESEYERVVNLAVTHGLTVPSVLRHLIAGSDPRVICERGFGCRHERAEVTHAG